jgi:DNA-binding response OmpR family regulator
MAGLRRKLEIDPKLPRYIRTEAGIGYRLIE